MPLLIGLFVCEYRLLAGLITCVNPPPAVLPFDPTQVNWDYGTGKFGVAIPHETSGRSRAELWNQFLGGKTSVLGFGFHFGNRGRPSDFMSTTIVVIPFWFPALISGIAVVIIIKREGLVMNWPWKFRRERRGFEPIMKPAPPAISSPLPAARTEE